MKRPFSKRNAPPPTDLTDELLPQVRSRILAVFEDVCDRPGQPPGAIGALLERLARRLVKEYGGLRASSYASARRSADPVIEHFYCCRGDEPLDFIEACFQAGAFMEAQEAVEEINVIFREHGVGFELTPYVEHQVEKETSLLGHRRKGTVVEVEYPRVIRRDEHLVHTEVVEPALKLLTDSRLRVANSEMLKAHAALRVGEYENAITLCGSAFESVLKTICDLKKWSYDRDGDTCAKLVAVCLDGGLFPPFYAPIFQAVGTVRNKLGDVHGRGPKPQHTVTKEQADHMVHMMSAHVLFLAKLAGLG